MYGKPVQRVNKLYVNRCSTVCTLRSSKWLESVQAGELHVTLSLNISRTLERCVKYHLYRMEAQMTKYVLQKYAGTCKYCSCIENVKYNISSDFSVITTMDKAGKVDLMLEAQG
jgi:hypothetical protein